LYPPDKTIDGLPELVSHVLRLRWRCIAIQQLSVHSGGPFPSPRPRPGLGTRSKGVLPPHIGCTRAVRFWTNARQSLAASSKDFFGKMVAIVLLD
jgi:hypothetical protein